MSFNSSIFDDQILVQNLLINYQVCGLVVQMSFVTRTLSLTARSAAPIKRGGGWGRGTRHF